MYSEWLIDIAYLIAGVIAGVVNTLAGGGAILTLSLLLFLGMPAPIANGTNRLGVLMQNVMGAYTFHRSKLLDIDASIKYILPTLIGAIAGAMVATDLNEKTMNYVVGTVMVFLLYSVLRKEDKSKPPLSERLSKTQFRILSWIIFLCLGFYGGFIQVGVGMVLLVSITSLSSLSLIRANAIKMLIMAVFTLPVFFVFVMNDQVDWFAAILLGIGQIAGTWLAGKYLIGHPKINHLVKWMLVVIIVGTIIKMFDIIPWLIHFWHNV